MMKKRDLKSLYSWAGSIVASSTPKKTEKRAKREQSATSEVESLAQDSHQGSYEKEDGFTVPSDTAVALRMIHGQFPKIDKVSVPPFVLISQVYSIVKDRTLVDRELEVMKQDKDVRVFKLSTGQDDFAIMFFDDYVSQVNAIKSRLDGKHPSEDLVIFDWYINHILPIHMDAGITDFHLESILSGVGHQIQERHISLLIKAGLLVRQLAHERSYWLAIPNIGSLLKSLSQGRKELLSLLNRRQYKEVLLSILEKKKLRMSQLDMRFHVRDLLGSGQLFLSHTPAGILVRIPRD
ncbi:hypothetical protein KP509_31G048200 [Ceratopteris richardii]|uniref:Serine/threonine-protein kinase 19 n=1 Tax=Ceratopteris richardii TaxID=49495 RepID=A0A8T2QZK5_CERRI|nr:hypothetical protein KP509_31G048200 [Ceratopteris richardii]